MSSRRRATSAFLACAGACTLWAGAARAETQLLAGKRLAILQAPARERLVLVSRDALVAPLPGGSEDPTLLGATLDIGNPRTGEWVRFTIPATGWTLNALGTVFRYEGGKPHVVPGSVRELVIRHGKRLKVSASAAGLTLNEAKQGGLAVELTTGSRRYCMMFGGSSVKRDEPRRFAARNAPAPSSCPVYPVVTSTTSTSTSLPRASTTTSTTRPAQQVSTSTSTSSTIAGTVTSTTETTSSTSSTSSSAPRPTTTSSTAQPSTTIATTSTTTSTSSSSSSSVGPTTSTSTSSSSSTSTSRSSTSTSTTSTSTSSTTSTTGYTCTGFALFCGGTCPPGATCVGGLITACHCEVLQ